MKYPSIGVFICHCGDNISGSLDIPKLKQAICNEGVSCVEDHSYLCSVAGQSLIADRIRGMNLDRIVVAACSPGIHEWTFRECVENAGLNPYLLDIANIREQCAWVASDTDRIDRAIDIIRSSIYAVRHAKPLEYMSVTVEKSVIVIGGGIAGMTAALSLARQGVKVYLIEKSPTIGGNMVKIGKVFSPDRLTEECALCSLAPLMGEVARNKNIELLTLSEVTGVRGHAGDFYVTVESGPMYVNAGKCTSCGRCNRVCNTMTDDEWNAALSKRKAVYRPFPQAVPGAYTIDPGACRLCGKCVKECDAGAIDLTRAPEKRLLHVGAIIVATGHREHDPSEKYELGYGRLPGVITQMELARILAVNGPTQGRLEVPSTKNMPRRVVMVQCVGSRDEKPGSIPYCSKICCMTALKHASFIRDHFPDTEVFICYTDIRTPGTYENYYREVQKKGVKFIRGRVGEVIRYGESLLVRVEDTLGSGPLEIESDMVVLSCALEPSEGTVRTAKALGIGLTPEFFIREKHPKLEPVSTTSRGIFVCGTAQGPMDITESIVHARAAASRVSELVTTGSILVEPKFAVIDAEKCNGCGKCVELCPYGAAYVNGRIAIDPLSCIGLGGCISRCPMHAISLPGNSDEELYARIDGCIRNGEPRIIAFLDENIAYTAADNIGVNRIAYPSCIRIIRVPSIMRIEVKHLLYAFRKGVTGIFLGDGTVNASGGAIRANVSKRVEEFKKGVADAGIDPDRVYYYEAYLPHFRGLAARMDRFARQLNIRSESSHADRTEMLLAERKSG